MAEPSLREQLRMRLESGMTRNPAPSNVGPGDARSVRFSPRVEELDVPPKAEGAGGAAGAKSPPVQIAWVGNSFVYFNKLPRMLAGMLAHDGEAVKQRDVLVGGRVLHGHSQDDNVTQLLVQRKWDVVVLQDQSAVPGGADEAKFGESITALQSFFAPKLIGLLCYLIHLFSIR